MDNDRPEANPTNNALIVVAPTPSQRKSMVGAPGDDAVVESDEKGRKAKVTKTITIEKCVTIVKKLSKAQKLAIN